MPLRKAMGQMYDWVTHVHTHMRGQCPHRCAYCYVKKGPAANHYSGPMRLDRKELEVKYGAGKGIFVEHCSDLGAADRDSQTLIVNHMTEWPRNIYVVQSKNPAELVSDRCVEMMLRSLPDLYIGTTIESDLPMMSDRLACAPDCWARAVGMMTVKSLLPRATRFISIEPIVAFDGKALIRWIQEIEPAFVSIGADSKRCGLLEPEPEAIRELILAIEYLGIPVKQKANLARLLK